MPRDADFSLTDEERRLRDRKRKRGWLIAIVLVIVLGVGAIAARPTRNAIKAWQARRQAEKAFAFIEQEKWKEAQEAAVAAYQLRQSEPEALRAVARFLSRVRQPQALEFWDKLKQQQPLTREDTRDEAAIAIALGDRPRAEAAINALVADDAPAPGDWLLAVQSQLQQGALSKALESVSKVFADAKSTPREQLQATLLQLQAAHSGNAAADAEAQRNAWQRLSELAKRADAVGLDSLVILAQRQLASASVSLGGTSVVSSTSRSETPPPNNGEPITDNAASAAPNDQQPTTDNRLDAVTLSYRIESHPLSKAPQKLLALDLRMQADPALRQELINRAVAEWKGAEAPSLAALATWLNGKGEFQRQLDTIPLESALQSPDLFLQHVDALGALGRWEEIRKLLDEERFPLDPMIQHMYLARCNAQLGNTTAAENSWQRAFEAAGADPRKLIALAEYAEKNGALQVADSAYTAAASATPKLRAAQQGRLRGAQAAKDTKRMHAILAEMLQLWPNDSAIRNDEAYTRLLLSSDPANPELLEIEKIARDLIEAHPASLPHRTLLALSLLKQGRGVAALQVYDGIQVAANSLTPSALAVHAATLSKNGQGESARSETAQIPVDKLLPEEEAGITNLRD